MRKIGRGVFDRVGGKRRNVEKSKSRNGVGGSAVRTNAVAAVGVVAVVLVAVVGVVGCDVALSGFDDFAPGTDVGRPVEQVVIIAFRNLATIDAVNVEFHTTTAPVANLPDGLFVEENGVTTNLGVAGTGLLIPGATDILELPCDANLIIGTAGGGFLNNETGEPAGRGEPRWLDATSVGLCGAIVGFTFEGTGGTFVTTVEIRR